MGSRNESVRLTIEGTDIMVSIVPETGKVLVTSAQSILEAHPDGEARDKGHTLIITRGKDNPDGRKIKRRPTHHVTLDHQITKA